MTRENLLFAIIGILLGFIVGFMFASSMSQKQAMQPATASGQGMPANHPPLGAQQNAADPQAIRNQVTASIEQARNEPNNFDAQIRAADLYAQIGRFEQGIEFLVKANQINPSDYDTIVMLGAFNVEAEHFDVAEKWYQAAMKMRSDDVRVLAGMAAVMLGRGDAKAAEDAIAKLEQASPNSVDLTQFKDRLESLKRK